MAYEKKGLFPFFPNPSPPPPRTLKLLIQERQCTYTFDIDARLHNQCCRGKSISITYSACASVAWGVQHARRMRRIILSNVVCPTLQYFSTLSHKQHDFHRGGGRVTEHKNVLYVCPCIIYEIDDRYPLDATVYLLL